MKKTFTQSRTKTEIVSGQREALASRQLVDRIKRGLPDRAGTVVPGYAKYR